MSDLRSTSWFLRPEQLQVACEALGIVELPRSRFVGPEIALEDFARTAGKTSLEAMRLVVEEDERFVVEEAFGIALAVQVDPAVLGVAFASHQGVEHRAVTFLGGIASTLVETADGVELHLEPAGAAIDRLERLTAGALAPALAVPEVTQPVDQASISRARWQSLSTGGHIRRVDAPLVARAARAALAGGDWEVAWGIAGVAGGYEGAVTGWVVDEQGLIVIDPDLSGQHGEDVFTLRAQPGGSAELLALWTPLRRLESEPSVRLHSATASPRRGHPTR